jgi:diadenosine tetraphosphatase ApaH/serine/threonine PP2A family protein phosphatase
MWSDPEDIETWAVSPRGAGWLFGHKVTSEVSGPLPVIVLVRLPVPGTRRDAPSRACAPCPACRMGAGASPLLSPISPPRYPPLLLTPASLHPLLSLLGQFTHVNGLALVARAHQLVQEGYKYMFPDKNLVTVWSAPNYCYRCGNVASILMINEELEVDFKIFDAVPESERLVPPRQITPYFI